MGGVLFQLAHPAAERGRVYPRRWKPGSGEVAEPSGTSTYNPVPLLVIMTQITGDQKYQQSAIRAAAYVWSQWGTRGQFIGGAIDNPNITDKEAGMLNMEAYLSSMKRQRRRSGSSGHRQPAISLKAGSGFGTFPCPPMQITRCFTGRRVLPQWV